MPNYNGKDGNGYQPPNGPPPKREYVKSEPKILNFIGIVLFIYALWLISTIMGV